MRHLRLALALITAAAALPLSAQQNRKSPHETISTVIGDRATGYRVTIVYGRPYTKDPKTGEPRKIWGGLVPWGEAYRLGADEATLLITEQPVVMQGLTIPAGAHTLYMVPSETGPSKLAVSAVVGAWGDPVDETHDLGRVDLKKDTLDKPVDQLTMAVEKDTAGGGVLKIMWESTQFTASFKAPAPHLDVPAASPTATLKQRVGLTDIEVVYSRPSMRGREVFGGLVPFGEVWRTGANNATRITFSTPVKVQGARVDAGTYELFTIPGREEWTVILQKASKQWGAYAYDQKNDVVRVTAKPVELPISFETFVIGINDLRDDSATLSLFWDKTRVPVKLEMDVVGTLVPQIEAAMAAPGKKPYVPAAMFYLEHNLDLKKAAGWMDAAIAEQPDFFPIIYRKALILAKMGDKAGAIAAATQSRDLAAKTTGPAKDEYIRLNEALIASLK
ncbi:MAG TPA: DUF2911 domain-containing protein [Opitutaceae bacterium]|nr:DUF2911 domain-containing protein [Opitutaceae bacterium]